MTKHVLLCADDFAGAAEDCAPIVELLEAGRLSAVSCFATTPVWRHAGAMLRRVARPPLLGLHFNLTKRFGRPAQSLAEWIARGVTRRFDRRSVRLALETQFAEFAAVIGRQPDFLDGHEHVHALPGIREVVHEFVTEVREHWPLKVRALSPPFGRTDAAFKRWVIQRLAAGAERAAGADSGRWLNRAFAGDYSLRPGAPFAELLEDWLRSAPQGGLIMCHPGNADAARRLELDTLRAPAFGEILARHGISLDPWADGFFQNERLTLQKTGTE